MSIWEWNPLDITYMHHLFINLFNGFPNKDERGMEQLDILAKHSIK
jgi:hypothetical protein